MDYSTQLWVLLAILSYMLFDYVKRHLTNSRYKCHDCGFKIENPDASYVDHRKRIHEAAHAPKPAPLPVCKNCGRSVYTGIKVYTDLLPAPASSRQLVHLINGSVACDPNLPWVLENLATKKEI